MNFLPIFIHLCWIDHSNNKFILLQWFNQSHKKHAIFLFQMNFLETHWIH